MTHNFPPFPPDEEQTSLDSTHPASECDLGECEMTTKPGLAVRGQQNHRSARAITRLECRGPASESERRIIRSRGILAIPQVLVNPAIFRSRVRRRTFIRD